MNARVVHKAGKTVPIIIALASASAPAGEMLPLMVPPSFRVSRWLKPPAPPEGKAALRGCEQGGARRMTQVVRGGR
mgnify:CR=1 FL=1